MTFSEWVLTVIPWLWLVYGLFIDKSHSARRFAGRWVVLLVLSLGLSYFLIRHLSVLMGGRLIWGEVGIYGWFLFAFFAFLQILKTVVWSVVSKMICWPNHTMRREYLQKSVFHAVLFVIIIPFFLAMTSIHRPKIHDALNPRTALGLTYEETSFKTRDGLVIKGWFIPMKSQKVVIIGHGLGANKSNFLDPVGMWHELGYNVLIFDFRGHGGSDGHTVSFGYRERLDVMAAMNYLIEERKFVPEQIIGYGVSFGGAAMIHAAREWPAFQSLIIDSSFASLDEMSDVIIEQQSLIPAVLRKLIKAIALGVVRVDLGIDIRERSPLNAITAMTGVPMLFIHGKGDPMIDYHQTIKLYEMTRSPKQIFLTDTRGHYATPSDPRYIETILNFLATTGEDHVKI